MIKNEAFLESILKQYPQYFDLILKHRDSFRAQIIYTRIDRKKNNKPVFSQYYFNVNPNRYFYPASTIKMPIAFLALEKLRKFKKYGIDKNTALITERDYSGQTAVYNDPTTPDGKPTIAHYIKKVFLISDNDACNRLYEFLGQEYLNKTLHKKGYRNAEIRHRLSLNLNDNENRHTNPIKFLNDTGSVVYEQHAQSSAFNFSQRNILMGNGYINDGKLIPKPFNFFKKESNYPDRTAINFTKYFVSIVCG